LADFQGGTLGVELHLAGLGLRMIHSKKFQVLA